MRILSLARMVARLDCFLSDRGFDVVDAVLSEDPESRLIAMGKPFVTPSHSSRISDLTDANSLWLFLRDRRSGEDVAGLCMRLDVVGSEGLGEVLSRHYARQYSGFGDCRVSGLADPVNALLRGRIVYFGDLYSNAARAAGGAGAKEVLAFCQYALAMAFMELNADWCFAFFRKGDALRGRPLRYGFSHLWPSAMHWENGPDWRDSSEYLAGVSRADVEHFAKVVARDGVAVTL